MTRGALRLALVLLLGAAAGLAWWWTRSASEGPEPERVALDVSGGPEGRKLEELASPSNDASRVGRSTVAVTVLDSDGSPVSEVTVHARPWPKKGTPWSDSRLRGDVSATTDVDGVARLSGLDSGVVHALEVSGKGDALGSVAMDPWTPRDEIVTLPRVRVVTGLVRDQAGRPVADARVLRRKSGDNWMGTVTDEQGRFRMSDVPTGDVVLRARVPGLTWDPRDTTGDVRVPAATTDVVLTVDVRLELVVRVENPGDLGPHPHWATLFVRRGEETFGTSSQGTPTAEFHFVGLESGDDCTFWTSGSQGPQGTYSVFATGLKPGADVRLRATPGRSISVRLKVPPGVDRDDLAVNAELDGLVVGFEAPTDGSFQFRGMPDGTTWTLTGYGHSSDGSTRLTGQATAAAGATVEIELKAKESPQGK